MSKKKSWLRVLSIVAVLAVAVTLAACGKSSGTKSNTEAYKSSLVKKGTLTIGLMGNYPPYSYRANGKLTGLEVEIGKQLAKRSGLKVKFVPTQWDSLLAGLGSKRFDLVLNNISVTPERKAKFLLATPYIESRYVIIDRTDSPITKLSQIKGKKFGVSAGSDFETIAKKNGAIVSDLPSSWNISMDQIVQKRIDGTINSREAWNYYNKQHPTKGLTYHLIPTSTLKAVDVAPLLDKNAKPLQQQLNKVMKKMHQDGTLTKISKKYFGADITQ